MGDSEVKPDPMTNPVTAVLNPSKDRILVFFVTKNGNVGMDEHPLDTSLNLLRYKDNGNPKGTVAKRNSISAVYLRGTPRVFGLANTAESKLVVAQLSPFNNRVAAPDDQDMSTTSLPSFTCVSDDKDDAWMYYLTAATEAGDPSLKMLHLRLNEADTPKKIDTQATTPARTTRLSAMYLRKERDTIVFYQPKTGEQTQSINYTTGNAVNNPALVPGSENAKLGTPLACYQDDTNRTFLYWMSAQAQIQRATRESDGTWHNTTDSMTKFPQTKLDVGSQLAVAQSQDKSGKRSNHVFYMEPDAPRYSDHVDEGGFS